MNLLLDTHIVIWFITSDKNLSKTIKTQIEDPENKCFISIASYWELSIKYSLGRIDLNAALEKIFDIIEESGFEILPITLTHILKLQQLEHIHNDPFDRIIIAQATVEKLTLVSKDAYFPSYQIRLIQ
ncbi:type II toxin-antitoxin system VapC family toxin [Pedobacter paludis]|uniref:PIN domain nuclease n=1 Tax=Pedobacter paludis TaxID=2203212 RepID=A0A317F6J7_9SPHI|nr:type II toxin-antitoxin system VapC family toxin [Pedobacter paludis]PWS33667.1 PIN domain nuclease [Pedobacter paludis]